jgi:hypothetical protein
MAEGGAAAEGGELASGKRQVGGGNWQWAEGRVGKPGG